MQRRSWSVREYAAMNGVSQNTIYAMVAANRLSHIRLGVGRGTIRILEGAFMPDQGDDEARPETPAAPTKPTNAAKQKAVKPKRLRPPS